MAIEIVDLPIKFMVIFHSYVNVYQAGYNKCDIAPVTPVIDKVSSLSR